MLRGVGYLILKRMIQEADIKRVSNLARLGLKDSEITAATKDVDNILQHFSVIQKIDTAGITASDEEQNLSNISRQDEAFPNSLASAEDLLKNVPQLQQNQIKVKAVFDNTDHKE